MNTLILTGRVVRNPDVRFGRDGKISVAKYTLAVQRDFKNKEGKYEADFIDCVCFGRQAEFVEKWVKQGTKLLVTGNVRTGSYEKKDGTKVKTYDMIVEKHEFCESKSSQKKQDDQQRQPAPENWMDIPDGVDGMTPFV